MSNTTELEKSTICEKNERSESDEYLSNSKRYCDPDRYISKYVLEFDVSDSDYDHGYRSRSFGVNKFGDIFTSENDGENYDEEIKREEEFAEKEMWHNEKEIPLSLKPVYKFIDQRFEFSGGDSSTRFRNEYLLGLRWFRSLNMTRRIVEGLEEKIVNLENKIISLEKTIVDLGGNPNKTDN